MCLDSKADFLVSTDIGYKYFRNNFGADRENGQLLPQFSGREFNQNVCWNNDGPYSLKEWIEDSSSGSLPYSETILPNYQDFKEHYKAGFHIYVYAPISSYSKQILVSAGMANLYKVEYKNIVAKGMKDGQRVIVARDMRILYKM